MNLQKKIFRLEFNTPACKAMEDINLLFHRNLIFMEYNILFVHCMIEFLNSLRLRQAQSD